MSYINESCGCSGGSNSDIINNSPILSGSQEAAFSPMADSYSFLDSINDNNTSGNNNINTILGNNQNNFSNNDDTKQNYSLDDLISMSKENKTSDENKFSNNNIQQMNNNNQYNHPTQATNNMLGNGMNNGMNNVMNNGMNNGMNQMPDPGMMRNMPTNVNPELQMVMNKLAIANQNQAKLNKAAEEPAVERESAGRFILKNFNIVLIVIIGLAWSDVAKFYINRSIKFGGGNHRYYVYYAVIATVILYGTSKYIHNL